MSDDNDSEFWETAADEIRDGEEVTVCRNGHVIVCTTLKQLWEARAELEED